LEKSIAWVVHNKEWLFSGAGLAVIVWIGRLIFKKMAPTSTQTIRSGASSTNVQAGRDVSFVTKKKENDVEEE